MDDWDFEAEAPPTFRPFTRDELQTIEDRIQQKNETKKKREMKRQENIKVRTKLGTSHLDGTGFTVEISNACIDVRRRSTSSTTL